MISNLSLLRPQRVSRRSSTTGIFALGSGSKRTSCHRGRKPCARLGTSLSSAFLSFVATPQGLLRPSPQTQAGLDLRPVCAVARRLPRILLHLHHCHPHHHRSSSCEYQTTAGHCNSSVVQPEGRPLIIQASPQFVHPSTHFPYPSS